MTHSYCVGYAPTNKDAELFAIVHKMMDSQKYPHLARWFKHMCSFPNKAAFPVVEEEFVFETAPAAAPAVPVAEEKKEEEEEEEEDLFGDDDDEEDEEAAAAMEAKLRAEAEKILNCQSRFYPCLRQNYLTRYRKGGENRPGPRPF